MSRRCSNAVLLAVCAALLLLLGVPTTSAAPGAEAGPGGSAATRAVRARVAVNGVSNGVGNGVVGLAGSSRLRRYPLLQMPLDVLDDEDDALFEANKRQMSDDYGHMRFGKRGGGENDFAEYGHMRFGRAAA